MTIMLLDTFKFVGIPTIISSGGPTIGFRRFTSILIGLVRFGYTPYSFTSQDDEPNNEVSG
ncbi:11953_t:CDS:2 [Gigaspora rosea]|nr:11953_t:CDS:2 [Gigaspora rosea]